LAPEDIYFEYTEDGLSMKVKLHSMTYSHYNAVYMLHVANGKTDVVSHTLG